MSNKGIVSVPMILTEQQEQDILRFYDTCEDGQGYGLCDSAWEPITLLEAAA